MPFVPITNGCKVVESFTFNGQPAAELVWGVAIPAALDQTDSDAISALFDSFWNVAHSAQSMLSMMSNTWTLATREITDVQDETGAQFTYSPADPGAAAVEPLPLGVALKATLYGSLRGRSYRGAKYFPGLGENNNTSAAAPSTNVQTWTGQQLAWLRGALLANTTPLAVLSRADGTAHVIESESVAAKWHYQRRRARGG